MTGNIHLSSKLFRYTFFVFMTFALFLGAYAQDGTSGSTIIDRLDKSLRVSVPTEYSAKLISFVATNEVMKSINGAKFTEGFIVNQMKSNWGISKENQLLFIWSAVYKQITNNDLYDGSDGDDGRLDEFSIVLDNIEQCGNEYVTGFNSYMETASAEAYLKSINESLEKLSTSISKYEQNTLDHYALEELAIFKQEKDSLEKRAKSIKSQFDINHSPSPLDAESLLNKTKQLRSDINNLRSRVNARRSAESIKEIMKADSLGVIEAAKYYILCMKNPATNDEKEIEGVKQALKGIIETCKVY